jgi:hypothetical protein
MVRRTSRRRAAVLGSLFYLGVFPMPNENGQLAMEVHDAPCANCDHVWITFQSVAVHHSNVSGNDWTTINVSGATLDVAQLNGTSMAKAIAVASLAAGHYEQIRLAVSHIVVGFANGTSVTASVPNSTSADVSGQFTDSSGMTTTISIDVDLASSLHVVGSGTTLIVVFTPHLGSVAVIG